MGANAPHSVLIVEDDASFRARFHRILSDTGNYRIVAAVDCVTAALQVVRRRTRELEADTCLDLLIVDLGLPDGNGLTVIQETVHLHPQCAVMVVTVFGDEEHVVKAIEAGASGYLLKDSGPEQLLGALDDLLGGGSPVNPMVARLLLNRMRSAPAQDTPEAPASILSERETEILTLVAKGFSFADICRLLGISTNTVKTHVFRIYRKLAVNSRSQAVYEATRLGLIDS